MSPGTEEDPGRRARSQAIRQAALDLGFDLVGLASAEDFGDRWDFYGRWLAAGYAGTMGYLVQREPQRQGPRQLMPECRSLVCVAQNYHVGPTAQPGELEGWISRYAWGTDYHVEMKARLLQLAEAIQAIGGPQTLARAYVDTGPILEREAAMRAGIGFIGKNTCVISQKIGSWIFLGEVLTNLDLEPDAPAQPHCGRCTRCLEACPTQAFRGPYLLDATRCISYLTIEFRGPIPREMRPLMGTHVFGCDICQAVCPWNRFAQPTTRIEYQPRTSLQAPQLLELFALDIEAWRRKFRESPVKRAKYVGFRRNVAVALGNSRHEAAREPLSQALADPEPLVRGHVAWALGRLGGPEARAALTHRLTLEKDEGVREELQHALEEENVAASAGH